MRPLELGGLVEDPDEDCLLEDGDGAGGCLKAHLIDCGACNDLCDTDPASVRMKDIRIRKIVTFFQIQQSYCTVIMTILF